MTPNYVIGQKLTFTAIENVADTCLTPQVQGGCNESRTVDMFC